jgi:hypothetical protein
MFKWLRAVQAALGDRWSQLVWQYDIWLWMLLLGILGSAFWIIGSIMTRQMLLQSTQPIQPLQVISGINRSQDRVNLLTIRAYVDLRANHTRVEVKTLDSPPQDSTFEIPLTQFDDLEVAIATRLGLPRSTVRRIVRYQIVQ